MRKILIALAIIIILTPFALYLVREPLIKMAINNIGTAVVKTDVSVQSVTFKPFSGFMELNGLAVANPEGYSNNNAIEIAGIRVKLEPKSLLSGAIQIQEITITEPQIRMEGGLKTNNLTAIQANLPQASGEAAPADAAPAKETRPVEIDILQIADGIIKMTKPIQATANLGTITVRDIGKAGSTATIADVFGLVMNRILSVGGTVISSEIGKKGREALQNAAGEAEGAAKDIGNKIGDKLKGLFGN